MNDAGGWRYVYASIPGVAHLVDGIDCQDACAVQLVTTPEIGPVLILAVADGAGSAAQSRAGAELACRALLAECATRLTDGVPIDWTRAEAETLFQSVRTALAQQAADMDLPVREFACTLLGAIVAADRALFLQIGDGAIVIGAENDYRPVFWPQSGEYANETRFATDSDAIAHLECAVLAEPVAEIALLTDGLQLLALHYRDRQAHAPFFRPMFQPLRIHQESGCPAVLATALEHFLASPAVNRRTHDDKTLVLATRLPPPVIAGATTEPADAATPTILAEPGATVTSEVTAAETIDSSPDITSIVPVADSEASHSDAALDRSDSTFAGLVRENNGDEAV